MSEAEYKTKGAYKELLYTEKNFILNMEYILAIKPKLLKAYENKNTPEDIKQLAYLERMLEVIEVLREKHSIFLKVLSEKTPGGWGEALNEMEKAYAAYFAVLDPELSLRFNKEAQDVCMKGDQTYKGKYQEINSYFSAPFQRVCRYPMLADALGKTEPECVAFSQVAKNFVSTVNQQTPESKKAKSEAEYKTKGAYKELLYTEKNFILNMEYILAIKPKLLKAYENKNTPEDIKQLAYLERMLEVIEVLREKHSIFLKVLSEKTPGSWGEALNEMEKAYAEYSAVLDPELSLRFNKEAQDVCMKGDQTYKGKYQEINSYFSAPFQRICRYPMLADALGNTEPECVAFSKAAKNFVSAVNQKITVSKEASSAGKVKKQDEELVQPSISKKVSFEGEVKQQDGAFEQLFTVHTRQKKVNQLDSRQVKPENQSNTRQVGYELKSLALHKKAQAVPEGVQKVAKYLEDETIRNQCNIKLYQVSNKLDKPSIDIVLNTKKEDRLHISEHKAALGFSVQKAFPDEQIANICTLAVSSASLNATFDLSKTAPARRQVVYEGLAQAIQRDPRFKQRPIEEIIVGFTPVEHTKLNKKG